MSQNNAKANTIAVLLFVASTAYLLVRIVPTLIGATP